MAIFQSDVTSQEDLRDLHAGNKFVCDFDELLLSPGRYHVNVFIRGGGEKQDFVEAALFFDVEEGHLRSRPIKFNKNVSVVMPHRWTVPL